MSYKINKKGKINKNYHCLDLLLNETYFKRFNPIIIRLKNPITYPEHHYGKKLIPEYTLDKFIVQGKRFKALIKKNLPSFTLEQNNTSTIIKIPSNEIEYDLENNPLEEVLDVLKDRGIDNFIGLYKIQSAGFYNSVKYYDHDILTIANGMLFFEKDEDKRLSPDEYFNFFKASRTNNPTFGLFFKNDEYILNTKEKLKGYFKSFLSEKMLDVADNYLSFNPHGESSVERFSKEWIEEQNKETSTHFITILENPIVSSSFTEKEKTDLIIQIVKKNNENRSRISIDSPTIRFFSKKKNEELKEIFKELNNTETNNPQMKIGVELKEILSELNKRDREQSEDIDHPKYFIKNVPWKEITLSKFPHINSKVDTPYFFHDDLKLRYTKIGEIYNKNETPVLYQMMAFLDLAYKITISLLHNKDDLFENTEQEFDEHKRLINVSDNIYLTNKNLFIKLPKPQNETGVNIPELMNFIVDSISIDNFQDSSKFQSQLTQKILSQKMEFILENNDGDRNCENDRDFKI